MAKAWIVSILVVGVIVGAVLYLTDDSPPDRPDSPELRAPPPLNEKEIQLYLEVSPELNRRMSELARKYGDARARGEKYEDPEEVARWIEVELKRRKMVLADWNAVRQRVEFVVGVMRYERDRGQRNARLELDIERTEELVRKSRGSIRARHEEDLQRLKDQARMQARPIHDESRRLATKYWGQLDRAVKQTK
ncbi:MAG: hypothetical protein ACYTGN_09810 [Planctomycetota bacterium]|jgi:hypothetical protein